MCKFSPRRSNVCMDKPSLPGFSIGNICSALCSTSVTSLDDKSKFPAEPSFSTKYSADLMRNFSASSSVLFKAWKIALLSKT